MTTEMRGWHIRMRLIGLIATAAIALSLPFYWLFGFGGVTEWKRDVKWLFQVVRFGG